MRLSSFFNIIPLTLYGAIFVIKIIKHFMQRKILFTGITIIFLFGTIINAQDNCKVLKSSIGGQYTGSCKKGLADGTGEAVGIDRYKGEFKKGLPDGNGTYIWQNGETYTGEWKKGFREGEGKYTYKYMRGDSVISGTWKEDKFIGELALAPYVIEYRKSISRVSCIKVGERPYVKFKFALNGGESNDIVDLLLQGSSGSESNTTSFTGFEQIIFPFKGKVTFQAPNAFRTGMLTCELRFVINEPGSWIITMFY